MQMETWRKFTACQTHFFVYDSETAGIGQKTAAAGGGFLLAGACRALAVASWKSVWSVDTGAKRKS